MGETDWGGNWVLFWWVGPCSVHLISNFLLMVELCSLLAIYLGPNYVELMKIMATSFKRSHACTAALSTPSPAAGHHWPMSPLQISGHFWASLGQSFVGSLLLSPGSWCAQGCFCPPRVSVSSVLWELCIQTPLAFKVKFPVFYIYIYRLPW